VSAFGLLIEEEVDGVDWVGKVCDGFCKLAEFVKCWLGDSGWVLDYGLYVGLHFLRKRSEGFFDLFSFNGSARKKLLSFGVALLNSSG